MDGRAEEEEEEAAAEEEGVGEKATAWMETQVDFHRVQSRTYSDHSSSDDEENDDDFDGEQQRKHKERAGNNTNANNNDDNEGGDGEESEYYEPRDSMSQLSGSERHLAEVLDRQLSALGQSCADENSLDPEDLKAPSVQTDPTNPNNDTLNSDLEEGSNGGGTPRGIEAELKDPQVYVEKDLDTGAEYLVGEEAANALLHKEKNDGRSEEKEKCTDSDRFNDWDGHVCGGDGEKRCYRSGVAILNEVERRERMSMKKKGSKETKTIKGETIGVRRRKERAVRRTLDSKKTTTTKPRNPGRWLKKRSTEAWNKTKEVRAKLQRRKS